MNKKAMKKVENNLKMMGLSKMQILINNNCKKK